MCSNTSMMLQNKRHKKCIKLSNSARCYEGVTYIMEWKRKPHGDESKPEESFRYNDISSSMLFSFNLVRRQCNIIIFLVLWYLKIYYRLFRFLHSLQFFILPFSKKDLMDFLKTYFSLVLYFYALYFFFVWIW